ncbi:primary amine oxidase [Jatropha curcas]|uniref:primary amine oxidase n=1 Tax=Jatropha curcas TaxID=180498 RepID=UPI0018952559|nr:primary amine oxidase [Jatropha curcas]
MEIASSLHFTFFMFMFLLLFAFFLNKPESSYSFTSKNRIYSKFGSVLETQIPRNPKINDYSGPTPKHPLDPLTIQEINKVRAILLSFYKPFLSSNKFPTIHSLSLDEPEKSLVSEWKQGDPFPPRKGLVIAVLNGQTHLLNVDLALGQVTAHEINSASGYPMLSMEDISAAVQVALSYKELNQSAIARGVHLSDLSCITPSPGWFGSHEEGRRVIKVQCFSSQGTPNFFMRPLEGLTMTVDLDKKEVVKFSDTGRGIPIPKETNTDYRYIEQEKRIEMDPINPISMEQPKGPSFTVENGHLVKWANWVFHLKADQREGMVISRAMVKDSETGVLRSVMYKGFCSEMFVPYMDPDENWYFKSYMDAGTPYVQPDMICLFERYAGDIGWRHSEIPVNGFKVPKINYCIFLFVKLEYIYNKRGHQLNSGV